MSVVETTVLLVSVGVVLALVGFGFITLFMIGERISEAKGPDKKVHKRTLIAFLGSAVVNAGLIYSISPHKWAWGLMATLVVVGAWGWASGIGDEIGRKYPSS
jgi:hypothetical protein